MKKLIIAGLCGVCMMSACVFATSNNAGANKVAGSGSKIHIRL